MNKLSFTGGQLEQLYEGDLAGFNFSSGSLGDMVSALLVYIFPIAGMVLLVYLVFGGYQVMLSGGDQGKIQQGREKITNALVGFLILFAAFWIVQFLGRALGLQPILDVFG
jgi:positive regulator of sigma E activity